MDAIKTFICGFGTGILFSTFLCVCYFFDKRLPGTKGNNGTADDLNREAADENRRITGLEQRETSILEEAERDNQAAVNLLKRAKDILNKHNNSSNSSDIDINL